MWLLDGTLENAFLELHDGAVPALVALPDNQHALSGSMDKTVKLFNVNDGAVVRTFTHHTGAVYCLALLPDGLRFVSGSEDNTARIVAHEQPIDAAVLQAWLDAEAKREAAAKSVWKRQAEEEALMQQMQGMEPVPAKPAQDAPNDLPASSA